MEFAFSKRVALASPVTLWSVLKTVAFSWQQDVLTNEAKTLFDLSRELYSRLATTASHIEKLGRTIERSVKDYNAFVGSLERAGAPDGPQARRPRRVEGARDRCGASKRRRASSPRTSSSRTGRRPRPRDPPPVESPDAVAPSDGGPARRRRTPIATDAGLDGRRDAAQTHEDAHTLPAGSRNHAMSGPCPLSLPRAMPRSSVPKSSAPA